MAFESHEEIEDSSSTTSLIDCIGNPWDEEDVSTQFGPCIPLSGSLSDSDKEAQKSVIPLSSPELSNSKLTPSDDSATNCRRCITDLPPALIAEILHFLDAKELGFISCVSTLLNRIASDHHGWKDFYCERWGQPLISKSLGSGLKEESSWKNIFVEREFRSKAFMGRYSIDVLYGHTEAVRAVFLLPSAKLIFTGGYDSMIRVWDMEDGLSIASSRHLGCTIRAVTADTGLLVAGGTDGFLQCWRAVEGHPHLFDLTSPQSQSTEFRLWEHQGPVTCLALDPARIYSGSWDMTIRIWDRFLLKCLKVLRHNEWVWSLVPRGSSVVSTAGSDVYVWDIEKGNLVMGIQNAHVDTAYSLARSHTGDLLFTGGGDGAIHMFEITVHGIDNDATPIATWTAHTGPVHSLAFEFPWLVSASSDGKLSLINVRKLLRSRQRSSSREHSKVKPTMEVPQKMLHGFGCNLFSVDIGADRIVCGGEEGVVRIWNFSQALEIERKAQALRGIRLENRMRRRKVQVEMNSKGGRTAQCSVVAKKNQMNSNGSGIWHSRRGVSGKLRA